MSIAVPHSAPIAQTGAGFMARIAAGLRKAQEARARRVLYQQTVRELRVLNDHQLADLGISRNSIEQAAAAAIARR